MEKFGKILLLLLNILIDIFLVFVFIILFLWGVFGITPKTSVQKTLEWVQTSWDALLGRETHGRTTELSQKLQKRAHREVYETLPNKRDDSAEDIIIQPYK